MSIPTSPRHTQPLYTADDVRVASGNALTGNFGLVTRRDRAVIANRLTQCKSEHARLHGLLHADDSGFFDRPRPLHGWYYSLTLAERAGLTEASLDALDLARRLDDCDRELAQLIQAWRVITTVIDLQHDMTAATRRSFVVAHSGRVRPHARRRRSTTRQRRRARKSDPDGSADPEPPADDRCTSTDRPSQQSHDTSAER